MLQANAQGNWHTTLTVTEGLNRIYAKVQDAAGNHSLTLLLAIPIALFVLAVDPGIWRRGRLVLACVGCCAVLMVVLFYGGVMEPTWIAGLAIYILIEKLLPRGWYVNRFTGFLLCAWGGAVLWDLLV